MDPKKREKCRSHAIAFQISHPESHGASYVKLAFSADSHGFANVIHIIALFPGSCCLYRGGGVQGCWLPLASDVSSWQPIRYGFLLDYYPVSHIGSGDRAEEGRKIMCQKTMDGALKKQCRDILMDPHLASRIVYSLLVSQEFPAVLYDFLWQNYPASSAGRLTANGRVRQNFRIVLDWSCPMKFDEPWEQRVWILCMWNELIREHLAWLSTLGGAFSSLGKIGFSAYAEKAGKISVSQLRLSAYVGDPILSSRSRIFFAVSLIQRRKFKAAQDILRKEYQFSRTQFVASEGEKLGSIIKSVWDYLVFEKRQRARSLEEKRALKVRSDRLLFDDGTIRSKKSLADTILAMSVVAIRGQEM